MTELKKINKYISKLRALANELHIITNAIKDGELTLEEYNDAIMEEHKLSWDLIDLYERINLLIDGLEDVEDKDRSELRRTSDKIMNPIKEKQLRKHI